MVGVLFIIGTMAGILSVIVVTPIINASDYLIKISENKNMVILGVLLVLTMGISLSMMVVVLYPVIKKYNEALALGAVIFRGVLELVSYLGIAVSWLLLITLSQEFVSSGIPTASNFPLMGTMLLDGGLQIGSTGLGAVFFSVGAFIIYYIFYKTKLIPRWLSIWGLIGGVLYIANPILIMFGFDFGFLVIPLAVQEMIMAVWLIVKGFNSFAFDSLMIKK